MTPTLISAFLTCTLVTTLTPGPNNILALSSVTTYGFRRNMRVLTGISLGFVIIMLIYTRLMFTLIGLDEGVASLLHWIGAGYILWLVWHIARNDPASGGQKEWPIDLWTSLGLQFVNVRIILYGITALSTFVLPVTREPFWPVMISLLLSVVGAAGNLCWALAGHLFQPVSERHGRGLNLPPALLLVWCAVRMFMG